MVFSQMAAHSMVAVVGVVLVLAADRGIEIVAPKVEPRVLTLAQFYYTPASEGRPATFTQQVISESGKAVKAIWSAEVSRVSDGITHQLCTGSGEAPYLGTTDTYTVDEWTGDNCPDLLPGDRAEATWEYTNHYGVITSLSKMYVIPDV